MKPSYLSSTLALAFIWSLVSVFVLIILAIIVAVFFPNAYNLASGEKLLVMVLLVAYIWFVANIVGAYLWSRKPDTKTEEAHAEIVKPEIHDLSFNKLDAYDNQQ